MAAIFSMIGGVSGLLSILAIAVYGGEIKRQTEINTESIRILQSAGSGALQTHVAVGDKESLITSDRITNISRLVEKLVEHNTALVHEMSRLVDIIKIQNGLPLNGSDVKKNVK